MLDEGEIMSIEPYGNSVIPVSPTTQVPPPLIGRDEIKTILYLGIRGDVDLPHPEGFVDILA